MGDSPWVTKSRTDLSMRAHTYLIYSISLFSAVQKNDSAFSRSTP